MTTVPRDGRLSGRRLQGPTGQRDVTACGGEGLLRELGSREPCPEGRDPEASRHQASRTCLPSWSVQVRGVCVHGRKMERRKEAHGGLSSWTHRPTQLAMMLPFGDGVEGLAAAPAALLLFVTPGPRGCSPGLQLWGANSCGQLPRPPVGATAV